MTGNISAKSDYRGKHMLKVFLVEDETKRSDTMGTVWFQVRGRGRRW